MTSTFVFAYATYAAFLLCLFFCIQEWLKHGTSHGLTQLLTLMVFCLLYYFLESWAGARAPFYEYKPINPFPHVLQRADMGWLTTFLASIGIMSGNAIQSVCAIVPEPATIPLCIPVAGGCISFAVLWTVRLLTGTSGFATEPFVPIMAPWVVGLVALWLDVSLDPILANSVNCVWPPEVVQQGLTFWTWHTNESLADAWFDIPLYNYAVWYASTAILAALVIWYYWFVQLLNGTAQSGDGAIRSLILFFIALVLFVAPSSANQLNLVYLFMVVVVLAGIGVLISRWESYSRDNPYRWPLVIVLSFYFVFPVLGYLFSEHFAPQFESIWLLLLSILVALVGVFFAVSPYWKIPTSTPPPAVAIATIAIGAATLGYLANA